MSGALDGATTALQRRIEELTAELERVKGIARATAEAGDRLRGEIHVLSQMVAAERAAREQAEAGRKAWHESSDAHHERALSAESALASARTIVADYTVGAGSRVNAEYCMHEIRRLLSSHPSPAPVAAVCDDCARDIDAGARCTHAPVAAESESEDDAESLIEQLDEALCTLLHKGDEIGEHSPRTHLELFYAQQAAAPVADAPTPEERKLLIALREVLTCSEYKYAEKLQDLSLLGKRWLENEAGTAKEKADG